jgi:hypothetical protein
MTAAHRERFRNRGPPRAIVIISVALTCSVVGAHYKTALSKLGDIASSNSSFSFDDREIAGGNSIVVDQRAPYEARALIPAHSTYRVLVGPRVLDGTELTEDYVSSWLRYFLMPRRPADDARWLICYGCDTSGFGTGYEVIWRDREGISIGRRP